MENLPQAPRSKRIRAIEKRLNEPIGEILRRLYYDEGLTLDQVAAKLRVPRPTLAHWMLRLGLNQRAVAGKAGKELAS